MYFYEFLRILGILEDKFNKYKANKKLNFQKIVIYFNVDTFFFILYNIFCYIDHTE